MLTKLRPKFTRYSQKISWNRLPRAVLAWDIDLGNWGSDDLFVGDINQDGRPELLWLQSMGIFKSKLYIDANRFGDRYSFLGEEDLDLFCLTVTDAKGRLLWRYGPPHVSGNPYCSHAAEEMVCLHDIDGDGNTEVLALNRKSLLVIDGTNGKIKLKSELPADNFTIVSCARNSALPGDVTILVSPMDAGYEPHSYGNPTLFIDPDLNLLHQDDHIGSGHRILICDVNNDGREEALIGYQLVQTNGDIIWTASSILPEHFDPQSMHVDHAELYMVDNQWCVAIAGSDKLYWIDSSGRTLWEKELPHPQHCLIGKFISGDKKPVIFLTNRRDIMMGFQLDGKELWRKLLPEHWPRGGPYSSGNNNFHKGIPAVVWHNHNDDENDLIVYSEGGWPYAVDGNGNTALVFPSTNQIRKPGFSLPRHRTNDFGMSFSCYSFDLDQDGKEEVIIYDRHHAWIYKIEE